VVRLLLVFEAFHLSDWLVMIIWCIRSIVTIDHIAIIGIGIIADMIGIGSSATNLVFGLPVGSLLGSAEQLFLFCLVFMGVAGVVGGFTHSWAWLMGGRTLLD
jgi:hypothetical protein